MRFDPNCCIDVSREQSRYGAELANMPTLNMRLQWRCRPHLRSNRTVQVARTGLYLPGSIPSAKTSHLTMTVCRPRRHYSGE